MLRLRGLDAVILRADAVLVGGIMSWLLLQAIGKQPAREADHGVLEQCRQCYGLGMELRHAIHLPRDLVWERPDGTTVVADSDVAIDGTVSDIGPATRLSYAEVIRGSGCVFWPGALGRVEDGTLRGGDARRRPVAPGRSPRPGRWRRPACRGAPSGGLPAQGRLRRAQRNRQRSCAPEGRRPPRTRRPPGQPRSRTSLAGVAIACWKARRRHVTYTR